jgi:hypothetical protein
MSQQRALAGQTESRRAIEALRAGVPNRDAVRQLGCSHPELETRFDQLLRQVEESLASDSAVPGILIRGDFGAGKSHLLEYLRHRALEQNFACSKVVISKETSLADPVKLFRAAVGELRVPGRVGAGIANVAAGLAFNAPRYTEFFQWAAPEVSALAPHFAGSLYVFEYGGDMEFRSRIERFWAGDPLTNRDLGEKLRLLGQQTTYSLQKLPTAKLLAFQRFRFLANLIAAAGYAGWVLLIDEVELIGQYSFKSRARGYGELARWMGQLADSPDGRFPGLGVVAAITKDFEAKVLTSGKIDLEYVPGKLRSSARDDDHVLATLAERGMRFIKGSAEVLPPLSEDDVRRTFDELRAVYEQAFGWTLPAEVQLPAIETTSVMRTLVRRWITEWDIARLFPGSAFHPQVTPLSPATYVEDKDLETGDNAGDPPPSDDS